jgi:hypothetical protein
VAIGLKDLRYEIEAMNKGPDEEDRVVGRALGKKFTLKSDQSLLDLILEHKMYKYSKKRCLRPWESFDDAKKLIPLVKEHSVLKEFIKGPPLDEEEVNQRLAERIKDRAKELFNHIEEFISHEEECDS